MKSFHGQHYRNRFPSYSRIRMDDNSVGGKILNVIGDAYQNSTWYLNRYKKQIDALLDRSVFGIESSYSFLFSSNSKKYINEGFEQDLKNNYSSFYLALSAFEKRTLFVQTCTANDNLISVTQIKEPDSAFTQPPTRLSNLRVEKSFTNENPLIDEIYKSNIKSKNLFINGRGLNLYIEIPRVFTWNSNTETLKYYYQNYAVPLYDEEFKIILRGLDVNLNPIEEVIQLNLGVYYKTKNKFMYLKDLSIDVYNNVIGGPAIEMQGFEGLVRIWKYPCFVKQKMQYDNIELVNKGFYLLDEENIYFSPCRLGVENGLLNYYFDIYSNINRFKYNEVYDNILKKPDTNLIHKLFMQQSLELEANESVLSFDYDYFTNHLVCLTNLGKLKYFSIKFEDFAQPEIRRTKNISLEIENTFQHVVLNQDTELNKYELSLYDRHYVYKTNTLLIFRRTPTLKANTNTFVLEFLNNAGDWVTTPYRFENLEYYTNLEGNEDLNNFMSSHHINSLKIPVTFTENGQYDFYVLSGHHLNNDYLDFLSVLSSGYTHENFLKYINNQLDIQDSNEDGYNSIFFELNYHSVLVERLPLTKSFDLTTLNLNWISENINKSLYINFESVNNSLKIYVKNDNNFLDKIYILDQHFDYVIFDNQTSESYFLEDYENLEVTFSTSSGSNSKTIKLRYE